MLKIVAIFCFVVVLMGLGSYYFLKKHKAPQAIITQDSSHAYRPPADSAELQLAPDTMRPSGKALPPDTRIDAKGVRAEDLTAYAVTKIGVPYKYGSTDPAAGFDCSGFITHVFNHFNIGVPRSSIDFTNVGQETPLAEARQGDLILFTGTNPQEQHVGHMGIVISNTDSLRFIHSSSGKAMGVTITPLNEYYKTRFVKVIRVL